MKSSRSLPRDNKGAIYEFKQRKLYDADTNNPDVTKSKNRRKQNLEDEKDAQLIQA